MTTPPSPGHDVHADRLLRARRRPQHGVADGRSGARLRGAGHQAPPTAAAVVSRDDSQVRATWAGAQGRCELIVRLVARDLQVRQCTWLDSGSVLDEIFVLHSREEFERWHAASTTKFDHPVAHDEIRRFAHASLSA